MREYTWPGATAAACEALSAMANPVCCKRSPNMKEHGGTVAQSKQPISDGADMGIVHVLSICGFYLMLVSYWSTFEKLTSLTGPLDCLPRCVILS